MRYFAKLFDFLIISNIFIALAALCFTLETQILYGLKPEFHPYLFIIFFATVFDYNLHRLFTLVYRKNALKTEKHEWLRNNTKLFYIILAASGVGFLVSLMLAMDRVILTLTPLAIITIAYSIPLIPINGKLRRLRDIPFLKIFLISINWTLITVLLPVIHSEKPIDFLHISIISAERFLFMYAICIPFDIRDKTSDLESGLKTIPNQFGERFSIKTANIALIGMMIIASIHYYIYMMNEMITAFLLSGISTMIFINTGRLNRLKHYHYGLLDGSIILQFALAYLCYQFIN